MTRYFKVVLLALTLLAVGSVRAPAQAGTIDPSNAQVAFLTDVVTQTSEQTSSGLPAQATPPRTLRAHWHVYTAFAATWLLLFGYAVWLGRRFGRLEEEIRQVRNV